MRKIERGKRTDRERMNERRGERDKRKEYDKVRTERE